MKVFAHIWVQSYPWGGSGLKCSTPLGTEPCNSTDKASPLPSHTQPSTEEQEDFSSLIIFPWREEKDSLFPMQDEFCLFGAGLSHGVVPEQVLATHSREFLCLNTVFFSLHHIDMNIEIFYE